MNPALLTSFANCCQVDKKIQEKNSAELHMYLRMFKWVNLWTRNTIPTSSVFLGEYDENEYSIPRVQHNQISSPRNCQSAHRLLISRNCEYLLMRNSTNFYFLFVGFVVYFLNFFLEMSRHPDCILYIKGRIVQWLYFYRASSFNITKLAMVYIIVCTCK